jgi:hypothetical protein
LNLTPQFPLHTKHTIVWTLTTCDNH